MRSLRFTPFGGGVGYHAEKDFLTACQIDERVSDSISMPTDSSSSQCATERERDGGRVQCPVGASERAAVRSRLAALGQDHDQSIR